MESKDAALDETLAHLEKVTGSEFIYVLNINTKFTDREKQLLDCFAILIEKDDKSAGYNKETHCAYFQDREDLIGLLDERRSFNFNDPCYTRFKEFVV